MLSPLCISHTVTYETSVNENCSGCMHDQFASDIATSDHEDDTHDPSTLSDRRRIANTPSHIFFRSSVQEKIPPRLSPKDLSSYVVRTLCNSLAEFFGLPIPSGPPPVGALCL